MILEYIKTYLNVSELARDTNKLSIFDILTTCVKNWSSLQSPHNFSESILCSTVEQLPSGCFLPIYFHAQNSTILIEIEESNIEYPLVSSWQVLLPIAELTWSVASHFAYFSATTYRLHGRSASIVKCT